MYAYTNTWGLYRWNLFAFFAARSIALFVALFSALFLAILARRRVPSVFLNDSQKAAAMATLSNRKYVRKIRINACLWKQYLVFVVVWR